MKKILLVAFSCQPGKGSEPGVGWNWALQAAKTQDVWVLTRSKMKKYVEPAIPEELKETLHFLYAPSSRGLRKITIYFEYLAWQHTAYRYAKKYCQNIAFDYVWNITFGNMFLPTYMYKLGLPFIWGPIGGAEQVPREFWGHFPLKKRLVHMVKYWMGRHINVLPWVWSPAKAASVIIARTQATKELFPQHMQDKVVVHLEACVDLNRDFYFSSDTPTQLKKSKGINLLYTGRIIDIKNITMLVSIMKDIVKEYPECKLHILGDGDERAESERLVEEYGLQKNVAFYGNIPRANLLKAVQECDAFVFPSLKEGAPWSLLEAMAFRKPIVAFDLNGMHDTLSSKSAILVNIDGMTPSESRTEFYKGIKRLLELSDTESCSMGAAAYKRLETVHSADGVKKYIKYIIDGAL